MSAARGSLRKHAVVIGGSIAGMIAARILSDHFEKVTVFERDGNLDDARPRPGVPQARHLHVLLNRGLEICESLFPGLRAGLMAEGAPEVRAGLDFRILYPAGWNPQIDTGMTLVPSTRVLLEQTIRRLLTAPNVLWNAAHQV
ncbi:MAG: 2-polyprenyl-6-methoxyphenol hydroxylase-like oxidoreductase, partial [Bryobacteraceae bacterium]